MDSVTGKSERDVLLGNPGTGGAFGTGHVFDRGLSSAKTVENVLAEASRAVNASPNPPLLAQRRDQRRVRVLVIEQFAFLDPGEAAQRAA